MHIFSLLVPLVPQNISSFAAITSLPVKQKKYWQRANISWIFSFSPKLLIGGWFAHKIQIQAEFAMTSMMSLQQPNFFCMLGKKTIYNELPPLPPNQTRCTFAFFRNLILPFHLQLTLRPWHPFNPTLASLLLLLPINLKAFGLQWPGTSSWLWQETNMLASCLDTPRRSSRNVYRYVTLILPTITLL